MRITLKFNASAELDYTISPAAILMTVDGTPLVVKQESYGDSTWVGNITITENAADGIFMSTPEGKVTYANRAGYKLFGCDYKQQEMEGLEITTLIPATEIENMNRETQSTVDRKFLLAALKAGSWRGELEQRRKDGSMFNAYSTVFAIRDETREQIALAAIIRDITEQKQAEIERERLQQEVIEAQRQILKELSTPVIPVMDRIIVMPGGDITDRNIKKIVKQCQPQEVHFAGLVSIDSRMKYRNTRVFMGGEFHPPEFTLTITDPQRISACREALQ